MFYNKHALLYRLTFDVNLDKRYLRKDGSINAMEKIKRNIQLSAKKKNDLNFI